LTHLHSLNSVAGSKTLISVGGGNAFFKLKDKRTGAKPLTRDEARRIALPELLGKPAK
jgi:hypothetical protein